MPLTSTAIMGRGAIMIVLAAGISSCGMTNDAPLPAPPWREPAETPYGDETSAKMERLAGHLQGAIDAGKPTLETYYLVPNVKAVAALREWYTPKAAALGYAPVAGLAGFLSSREAAFGYRKNAHVLVVGWIRPKSAEPVPVIIQRFGRPISTTNARPLSARTTSKAAGPFVEKRPRLNSASTL